MVAQDAGGPVAFMHMIERASRDPNVDIDKMERLMAMHERMVQRDAETAFNNALVECQQAMRTIGADKHNSQTRSNYLTFAKLDKVLRPIYSSRGISISFGTDDSPKPECVRVIAHVSKGGFTRVYKVDMPADGKGAKGGDVMTKTHATGAAIAYGSRYLLKAIFNVAVGEEDDDGNLGDKRAAMPEGQKADFLTAIEGADKDALAVLWDKIRAATAACGDIEAHEELRAALLARKKVLK